MRELRPNERIGLVVNARGETSITAWAPGRPYYEDAVSRARAALEGGAVLGGILWHQGESDRNLTASYLERLANLVAQLREDLNAPGAPFVAGMLEQATRHGRPPRPINEVLARVPASMPNTAVASSEGLRTFDGTHFDTPAQRELGRRYAEALHQLRNQE